MFLNSNDCNWPAASLRAIENDPADLDEELILREIDQQLF